MLQDLKAAFREIVKNPWFACITVLTLALGIGANTAIFGVVNRLVLNPLPYPDSEELVYLRLVNEREGYDRPATAFVVHAWREQARSLDGIEAFELRDVLAYDDRGARVVPGLRITPGLPAFLGVAPVLGRGFTADDAAPGAPAVVLLSYEIWQREYGGARDVLGRTIKLDEVLHEVVGVMPARWDAISTIRGEVWLPLELGPAGGTPTFQFVEAIGRLRPGTAVEAVSAELDALVTGAMAAALPAAVSEGLATRITAPFDLVGANTRTALLVLLGAVALVLLVACSNVANLLLARGASRARALALRAALGASTWRLVRALLTECLVLALAAGLAGLAIGWLTLKVLARVRPDNIPEFGNLELDPAVLAFTFGASVLTALLFGLAPAVQLRSGKFDGALRHGASGVMRGGAGARMRKLLVAAQMAISVVLLVSAGLLVRSVINLQHVDVGYDTENLFTVQFALPRARYENAPSREVLSEDLLGRIRALPGVAAVTQAFVAPPNNMTGTGGLEIRGGTLSEADARTPTAFNYVRPDYFNALGIPLLEGRTFTADELRSGSAVIINRAAADRFWPDGNALGGELKWRDWGTVVGIVDDVVTGGLRGRRAPHLYWPFEASRVPGMIGATPGLTLIVRAAEDPAGVISQIRAVTQALDPEIAIPNVLLTETALANTIAEPRFNMALLTAFAVIALVLAAVGLAAVIRYEVTERTHEIGIRMALGARTENVRRLAMSHGLTPALVGVVVGVIGALGATQLATRLLYDVAPRDPLTFVGVAALLVVVAIAASWLPARRATRVDPITALRAE